MLNPQENEMIIDPACGSGGFLAEAMKHVFQSIDTSRPHLSKLELQNVKADYARIFIHGIDINLDLARVSKMRMILYDDGHTGIFSANSLDWFARISEMALKARAGDIKPRMFETLLTNPPFGSRGLVTDKTMLENYNLAHKWRRNEKTGRMEKNPNAYFDGQVPDILFIERCLDLLKDYGRLAIVLLDGILTNSQHDYVREYIKDNARLIAVVSLPQVTFVPHGANAKTSLILLQKLPQAELTALKISDYPIFMAICERIGYDIRGRVIHKKNDSGQLINTKGEVVTNEDESAIDTDVDEIIQAFDRFKRDNNLNF